ncbi:MAG: HD domain-containing protein [Dehalococcoidales bacterium]
MELKIDEKYSKLLQIVEKELSGGGAHTLDHIQRVWQTAMQIASEEKDVDLDVLKTAVLLHDIARVKEDEDKSGKTDHAMLGAEMAAGILKEMHYPEETIRKVQHCIQTHRFKGSRESVSIEAKILSDADKLDALGAIGIARAYMLANEYHEQLYSFVPVDEYAADNLVDGKHGGRIKELLKHTPNLEFETKMRHIPGKLHTAKAKEIAGERVKYMAEFFDRLRSEIAGDA